jgi:hypothetical protein
MNNNFFNFISLSVLSLTISAQQASRFPIKPTSVWRINYEFCCSDGAWENTNGDEEYKYFIDGDTVINSGTYFKLYKTGILYLDTPFRIEHKYIGAIRDSSNNFFYVDEGEQTEYLLYNFNAGVGEVMQPDGFPVDEIDTLENGRKRYQFFIVSVHCGSANTIIEGVGWLGGLLEGNSCSGHPGVRGSYTVCYSENDEVIYQTEHTRNGNPVVCNFNFSAINENKIRNEFEIVVLPDKTLQFVFPNELANRSMLEIYSVSGIRWYCNTIDLMQSFSVNKLVTGVYIARIQNNNKSYSVKFVIE